MTWLTSTVMLSSLPGPSSTHQMDLIALYDLIDLKDLLMIWLATKPIPWFDSFQDLGPRIAYSMIWLISTPSDHKAHTMIWMKSNQLIIWLTPWPTYYLADIMTHFIIQWKPPPCYLADVHDPLRYYLTKIMTHRIISQTSWPTLWTDGLYDPISLIQIRIGFASRIWIRNRKIMLICQGFLIFPLWRHILFTVCSVKKTIVGNLDPDPH
jgi:hypothetical protein